ncbi:PilZ domain-containing protein [Alteromonas mediterranea]|uniref:Pilus assembly protein PilZ n=1 Tax=Alteromonas mediterranea TaxID=314275 RepID=A0AAC8XLD0_9ALTE|nr:PilZ domain-containing protein [Alteromonas mediterranea]MBR9784538.1 PilZ domain-containing protein [Gammaproteobacteria bacterium]AFV86176.1 type IV pilus assembly PilZ [Alteromonas mediterranea DE1]AGP98188.1 type IV pilus assembly PilZ [Alteromonas mediterranea UM7]AGQ02446.1 type IV pilus assembly PilZ [Alteromonas mediterranea UM4b]AMJ79186.1 pilus assembly protein PilZ [Alteromonas mediterranea]|tara:strand:+ start:2480 stop:5005 length:2526 start_codon:yes stop_codon:yes gene_type:complete
MSQDLKQYADIIEQLKPMVNEPEFNQVLLQTAADVPKEKRFLIKMEVKRLAKPCMRTIDLRGHVDGKCKKYVHEGRSHYMDDLAVDKFEEQIRVFGRYTYGVYEAVQNTENNFRLMREKELAQERAHKENPTAKKRSAVLEQFKVPTVNLLDYRQRNTERMNFAVAVEVFNNTGQAMRGLSVDISLEGLQIKLAKDAFFKTGETLFIFFRGLENEFAMDKKNGIAYKLVKIITKNDVNYLALQRDKDCPSPAFDKFLESFIHGNKRRYKVNMSNTIEAITSKTCEQYFSPRSPTLPVYIDVINKTLVPRFAMVNEVNRETVQYWQDEEENCRLNFLLTQERLMRLLNKSDEVREIFVFSFTHLHSDKVYFYSASFEELLQKDILLKVFLGFGSKKASWRVFKITLTDMVPEQAHIPLSIPDSVGSKVKKLNTPPSARLMSKLKNLRYLAHVTDVTSVTGQETYNEFTFNRENLSHLRVFGHPRNRAPSNIHLVRFKYEEQRIESRYQLRTQIEARFNNEDAVHKGVSEDISVHGLGLRVELNKEYKGSLEGRIEVAFPRLQEIANAFDVMHLQYEIIYHNVEKNILHLKTMPGEEGKSARAFFEELIKKNKANLKVDNDEEEVPGIGQALRCINARNATSLSFLMSKEGVRYTPQACIVGKQDERITTLTTQYAEQGKVNLEFLFRDRKQDSPFVQSGIKAVKLENMPLRQELFISFDASQKEPRMAIIPRYSDKFESNEQRRAFIREAMVRGQFIAIHVMLTTTGKPDMSMLQTEINYVTMYAMHRARELEKKMWSIAACSHLVDVTDEVLIRYGFTMEDITANKTLKSAVAQNVVSRMT